MKKNLLFMALILTFSSLYGQTDRDRVIKVLQDQSECWNRADIDCFMESYWKSDSLMFIGSGGIVYGWKGTYERYKKNYPNQEAMGKLRFEILEANSIDADVFFVVGKFFLERTIGDLEGIFTLVFKKIEGNWVIISDHTG